MKFRPTNIRFFILALLTALSLTGGLIRPAAAQGLAAPAPDTQAQASPISMSNVRVDIWPEYDQPAVLVIHYFTLSSTVTLPATLSVRIPAAAGKPYAVAYEDGSNPYSINYTVSAAGDWIEVKFTTPMPNFRLEYYDPSIKKTGTKRDFTYQWPGDYSVETFALRVQQPINATNMTFLPAAGPGSVQNGLTYYDLQAGRVPVGTTFDLSMSYEKPDDTLTSPSQFQPAQPNQTVDATTAGRVRLDQVLPWAVGGIGLLLIAGGLFWYIRTGRAAAVQTDHRDRRHTRRVSAVDTGATAGETIFCAQCGKRAGPADVFCRSCGTRLR